MSRRVVMAPLDTRIAAKEIAAAWIEGALDAGIPRDAVAEVEAEWIAAMGNAYWDRVAWSWRRDAGPGRDGYDVLARVASQFASALLGRG